MNEPSTALQLADWLEDQYDPTHNQAAAAVELRRLRSANLDCMDHFNALMEERNALLEALKQMIDLAEFWINHRQERHMSEEQHKVWLALGHESAAMRNTRSAIAKAEE